MFKNTLKKICLTTSRQISTFGIENVESRTKNLQQVVVFACQPENELANFIIRGDKWSKKHKDGQTVKSTLRKYGSS